MHAPPTEFPLARVTLRAHRPAPARVELRYQPLPGRLARTVVALAFTWGLIPLLIWVPPHYPWVALALASGAFIAHRSWTGRYRILTFAGICPRCGHALSLGVDRAISLPHTLTCYACHFEPSLEVSFERYGAQLRPLAHRAPECTGNWRVRWLADEPWVVCELCLAGTPATETTRSAARAENERGSLLERLAEEGRGLV